MIKLFTRILIVISLFFVHARAATSPFGLGLEFDNLTGFMDDFERQFEQQAEEFDEIADDPERLAEFFFGIGRDSEEKDDSWWGRLLRHDISLNKVNYNPVAALDGYNPIDGLFTWDVIVGTKDAIKAFCFALDIWIEKRLYEQATHFFMQQSQSNFNNKRDALVRCYNESKELNIQERNKAIVDLFCKEFNVSSKITLPLCRAIGFSIFLHYLLEMCEKAIVPDDLSEGLVNAVKIFNRLDQPRNFTAVREPLVIPVRPVSIAVQTLKNKYLGYSLAEQNLRSIREFCLGFVMGMYPEGHWYNTFLTGLKTVTDHNIFVVVKKLYMWYRCIHHMQNYHNSTLKKYAEDNIPLILAYLETATNEDKSSKKLKDADQKLKEFLKEMPHNDFLSWTHAKNQSLVSTSVRVETVLQIPAIIELVTFVGSFISRIASLSARTEE